MLLISDRGCAQLQVCPSPAQPHELPSGMFAASRPSPHDEVACGNQDGVSENVNATAFWVICNPTGSRGAAGVYRLEPFLEQSCSPDDT